MGSYFVKPETATLTLEDGERLIVRRELNAGEERAVHARLYVEGANGRLRVDPLATGIALMAAYLLDWTLADDDGPVVIRGLSAEELIPILNRLRSSRFTEIKEAIERHIDTVAAELAEKKTELVTTTSSDPTSTSVN